MKHTASRRALLTENLAEKDFSSVAQASPYTEDNEIINSSRMPRGNAPTVKSLITKIVALKDEGARQGELEMNVGANEESLRLSSNPLKPLGTDQQQKGRDNASIISSGCLPGGIPGAIDPSPADRNTCLIEDPITPGAIGSRTPLILIHGIWGGSDYFTRFLSHFESISGYLDFKTRYKVYRYEYDSDKHSVWEIARSLRNWLDYKAKQDPNIFKNLVIIAHSMGGLVARSYMNEHDTDYDPATGGQTRRRAGERINFLITLATPHHGSPLSNENVRVPNGYATWNAVVGIADGVWGIQGCIPCITNPQRPNRSDLRWDNYDNLWPWTDYNKNQERNDWLRNIPHTYDSKIIAYGGYIGTNPDIVNLGQAQSGPLLAVIGDRAISHENHLRLAAVSVLLDRIFHRNFVSPVNQVYNDGAVPISSSLFYGHPVRRVTCPGYDHTDMKDGRGLQCNNGLYLWKSVEVDLSLTPIQVSPNGNLTTNPSAALSFGNIAIGNSSTRSLVLSNTGNGGFNVTSLSIIGSDSSQFSLDNPPSTPFTIAAGQSRTLTVRYSPTSSGNKSASLTIYNTSANIPVKTISLSGGGSQAGCSYALSSLSRSFTSSGGSGSFAVQTSSGCGWTVQSNADWITITSGSGGTGTQTVSFTAAINPGSLLRVGTITVQAGTTTLIFTVAEDGNSAVCNYSLSSNYQAFAASGGSGSFIVAALGSCGWSASSNAPWIILDPGSIGLKLGTQSINFSVASNSSNNLRFGTIAIQGQGTSLVFTVSQDGSVNNCTYSLSTSAINIGQPGGQSGFTINAGAGCPWQVLSQDSWITILSSNNGYGSQAISFSVLANQSTNTRYGSIAIQGSNATLTVSISQTGLPIQYPVINLPNTSLSMGDALVSSTIYQGVVINNTGQGNLILGSVYRSSGSTDFDVLPYVQNQIIAPGGTASITIKLTPTSTGSRSASFSISSNDPNQPNVNFSTSGTGMTQLTGGIDFVWTNKTTIPVSEFIYCASAVINNNIYVFGGSPRTLAYKYDPTVNTWTRLADAPFGTTEGGAAVINGKIYLVGHPSINNIQIYDPITNSWTVGAPIPTPRRGPAVAVANGKLYVIGGNDGSSGSSIPIAIVEMYDPQSNTWVRKADLPTARAYLSGVMFNNLIYIIGGQGDGGTRTGKVEVYDPAINTWTAREDMPTRRSQAVAVVLGSKIYVIGGSATGPDGMNTVEEHDPSLQDTNPFITETWFARNPLLFGRAGAVAGVVNNKIYVIGGRNDPGVGVTVVEEGTLSASPKVSLPSSSAAFGDVPLGITGEKTLEIQNLGNALLTLSYSQLSGGQEFSLFRAPNSLAAGASAQIKVRVVTTSTGNKNASYRISTNDPATPSLTFSLTANGVAFQPIPNGSWQITQSMSLSPGPFPRSIAIKDGKAYVSRSNASLSVIDLASNSVITNISFTPYPNSDTGPITIVGNKVYVPLSNLGSNGQLAVINRDNNTVSAYVPIGSDPRATAAYGDRLYVSVRGTPPEIKILDTNTNAVVGSIPLGGDGSYFVGAMAIESSLGKAYVTTVCAFCGESGTVSIIDLATNSVVNTIAITSFSPFDISIAGNRAYVSTNASVEIIDLSSNTVVSTIILPDNTYRITATSDYVLALNYGLDKMIVISTSKNAIVGEVNVFYPLEIGSDPSTNYVYIGTGSDSTFKTLRLVAPGFSVSTNAQSLAAVAGGNTTFTTTVASIDGFNGAVNLSCEGLPSGATCQFSQNPVNVPVNGSISTDLIVNVPAGTVSGPYSLRVVGSGSTSLSVASKPEASVEKATNTIALSDFQNLSLTVPSCDFLLSAQSISVGAGASTGSVVVSGTTGCSWTAVSNDSWITITSGASGTGSGTVGYSISANTGSLRTGTITITGQTLTVTQCSVITIIPSTLTAGTAGTPYPTTQLMASGGVTPYTFTMPVGALPNGMMMDGAGLISGTPTVFGTFNFTVRATDSTTSCFGEQAYSLVINSPCGAITVNPSSMPNGFVSVAYPTQTLSATGGTPNYTFTVSAGSLPNGLNLVGNSISGTPTLAGIYNFTIKATDANGCMGTRAYTVVISGSGPNSLMFYPLAAPVRLLDTRTGEPACFTPGAPVNGGTSLTQLARGTCGIPAAARAVTGNVTVVTPPAGGYLTIYPSDATQPLVANTNYAAGEILNNVFTVGLGNADGSLKIFAQTTSHVVMDITGYYAPPATGGLYFHPLPSPIRLLETRPSEPGCFTPGAPIAGNTEFTQQGTGTCNGVTIPASALALVGNATTVSPVGAGFLTFFPANATRPLIASGNYDAGEILNSPFTVGLSPTGQFKIYALTTTHLVVDVLGYFSPDAVDANGTGLLFNSLTPTRLLDTRPSEPGCFTPGTPLNGGSETSQAARGVCTIASTAQAIVGNVTVVLPASGGFLTFWPSNVTPRPGIATSNYAAGSIFNRYYTVGLGTDGAFKMFAQTTTHVVVDVSGYFAP